MTIKNIFLVTSVRYTSRNECDRCWGWYPTEKEAKKAISVNDCDMQEHYYNYIILEQMPPYSLGCSCKGYKKKWYKWQKSMWKSCKEPVWAKNVIGWGVG